MDDYTKNLIIIINCYKDADKKDKKSKKLSKVRSDEEAIEYRKYFENFYANATIDLMNSIKLEFGGFLDSPLASKFCLDNDAKLFKFFKFLTDHLVLPHAVAQSMDYRTNSKGSFIDIAKICNLYALTNVIFTMKEVTLDKSKMGCLNPYKALII